MCVWGIGDSLLGAMIVGEAPGSNEDKEGKPFVGRSGKLLDESLSKAGFDRKDFYVTNVVKCRPPENRTPTEVEIVTCASEYLIQEFKEVKPKYILLLGNTALHNLTIRVGGIKKNRGIIKYPDHIFCLEDEYPAQVYATYHPSAALRSTETRQVFEQDVKAFTRLISN